MEPAAKKQTVYVDPLLPPLMYHGDIEGRNGDTDVVVVEWKIYNLKCPSSTKKLRPHTKVYFYNCISDYFFQKIALTITKAIVSR